MSYLPDLASTPPVEGEHGYFSSKLRTPSTLCYLIAEGQLVHYSLAVKVAAPPFATYKGIVPKEMTLVPNLNLDRDTSEL